MLKHLQEIHQKTQKNNIDFYTPAGLHIYFKDKIENKDVNVEKVISKLESKIPLHLFADIEMIIIGWFDEFAERDINAFNDSGTICISNFQDDEDDLLDDLIHEIAHATESEYGYTIYADEKIKDEFLRKRKHLHDILWSHGYKAPLSFFMDPEFSQEFDDFLHKKVGYDKLSPLLQGLFINAYAATSLREYYATAFTEYYMDSNHNFLKNVSPQVYKKINDLQKPEFLDNSI